MSLSLEYLCHPQAIKLDDAVKTLMIAHLKTAADVRELLFPDLTPPPLPPQQSLDMAWIRSIAVALVAAGVGSSAQRNFSDLIDRPKARSTIRDALSKDSLSVPSIGMLYDQSTLDHVCDKNNTPLIKYKNDHSKNWGNILAEHILTKKFITEMNDLPSGPLLKELNLLRRTIKALIPTRLTEIEQSFNKNFPENYLTLPDQLSHPDYPEELFLPEIQKAMEEYDVRVFVSASGMRGGRAVSKKRYAARLLAFLNNHAAAYRTATKPDDRTFNFY